MAFQTRFIDSWQDKKEAERALNQYLEPEKLGREFHYSLYVRKL